MLFRLFFCFTYIYIDSWFLLWNEVLNKKNCWLERCVRKSLKRFVSFHRMGKNFFSPLCSRRLHNTKNQCASGWSGWVGIMWSQWCQNFSYQEKQKRHIQASHFEAFALHMSVQFVFISLFWQNSFTVVKCIVLIDLLHSSLLLMLSLDLQIDLNGIP